MNPNSSMSDFWKSVGESDDYKAFKTLERCPFSTRGASRKWLIKEGFSLDVSEYITTKYRLR